MSREGCDEAPVIVNENKGMGVAGVRLVTSLRRPNLVTFWRLVRVDTNDFVKY